MSLSITGTGISDSNVTNITDLGFWVMIADKEYFIPFSHYPAFRHATINQIVSVTFLSSSQLSWKDLDIDIELEALEKPESFPLIYQG